MTRLLILVLILAVAAWTWGWPEPDAIDFMVVQEPVIEKGKLVGWNTVKVDLPVPGFEHLRRHATFGDYYLAGELRPCPDIEQALTANEQRMVTSGALLPWRFQFPTFCKALSVYRNDGSYAGWIPVVVPEMGKP